MSRARSFQLLGAVLLSVLFAYFLRDVIYQAVIVPLAYLWWVLGFYYSLIPQLFLWTLLLIVLCVIGISAFAPVAPPIRRRELKRRPTPGQVEVLAMWLVRAHKGNYFRWQIASRLGRIARAIHEMSGRQGPLEMQAGEVGRYLDAGLNTSFVDYPRARNRFQRPAPTPIDLDPRTAVDYLEGQLENSLGKHP